jgi:Ca-activated chloride channel family protein
VDSRVVNEGGETRRVTQPVELPSGWETPGDVVAPGMITLASAVAPMPPQPPSAAPRFAPARADASARAVPLGFAAVPAAVRAGKAAFMGGAAASLDDMRAIAATEAQRLRDAAALPAYERRDLLDDLSSRLTVLVGALADDAFTPLRDLVTVLNSDVSTDEKWASALEVLTAFAGKATPPPTSPAAEASPARPDRKTFWKR